MESLKVSFVAIYRHFFLTLSLMQVRAAWQVENINQKESSPKNVTADGGRVKVNKKKIYSLSRFSCFLPNRF